ncbi:MFS transporter [Actinoallomurus sp. NPDC052274]|uniref:MFS transporter n=1 Tax=Actinoallomurus sp. NPDC052274 TaxID=3155420 RepID=UPI003438A247
MSLNGVLGTAPSGSDSAAIAHRRRWMILAVACTSLLLCGIDLTVLHVSVPEMTRHVHPSGVQLLWIVDVYSLTVAALLVTCGTLGDRVGRRRLLLGGFALFGVASATAAFSTTAVELILARALLGVGAAMIMASTVAIIRVVFSDDRERTLAIGIWTAAHSVGATVGPLLGGALVERWWWGAVFLVNVPIVVVILIVGALILPESRDPTPRRWDLSSVALSVAGLAGVVYALKQVGEHLRVGVGVAVIGAAGVALLTTFVVRQRRLAQPLLDLSLLADRRVAAATICVISCFGGYTAMLFFFTQWLQWVGGYSPLRAGLALMPLAGSNAVGAVLAPWAARRVGARWAVSGALALFAAALATLALLAGSGPAAYGVIVVTMVAAGTGAGVIMTLGADLITAAADPRRAGEAAAIQETSFELGAGLGVAVLGTVLAATYRTVLPSVAGLSTGEQRTARESIGAAVEVAGRLDAPTGQVLRRAARDAYGQGFTTVAAIAAVILGLTAFLAVALLRPATRVGAGR